MTIAIPLVVQAAMAVYSAYNAIQAIKNEDWGGAAMSVVGAYVGFSAVGAGVAAANAASAANTAGTASATATGLESAGAGLDMSPTIANASAQGLGDLGTLSSTVPTATAGVTEIAGAASNIATPTSGLLGGLGDIATTVGEGLSGAWEGLVGGLEGLTDIGGGLVKDLAGNTFDAATGVKTAGGGLNMSSLAKPLLAAGLDQMKMNKTMDYNDKVREKAAAEREATRSRRASIDPNAVSAMFAKYKN